MAILAFLSLEAKPLTWGQIWRRIPDRAVNWLSIVFFRAPLALLGYELQRLKWKTIEHVKNRKNFTFDDLWWPDLWPEVKNDRSNFVMILDELSNAAYPISLRGPGAELDGGFSITPPPSMWCKI